MKRLGWIPMIVACGAPAGVPSFDDNPADTDTDEEPVVVDCSGTLALDWSLGPAPFTADPVRWEQGGLDVLLSRYGEPEPGLPSFIVDRTEEGCLHLHPGAIGIETTDSGCAAERATIDVTDQCGGSCTQVVVLANADRVASTANSRTGVSERLELRPADAFNVVAIASLNGVVCGVDLKLTELPEALQPVDTGSPF